MEREERKLGRSRLWRGVAVVGMSVGLMFVTTTPSQAVDIPVPTIPLNYAPQTLFGTAVAVTGLAAAGTLAAPAVAVSAALLTVGGASVYWASQPATPSTFDVKATWATAPYLDGSTIRFSIRHPNQHPFGSNTFYWRAKSVHLSGATTYDAYCVNTSSAGSGGIQIGEGKTVSVGTTSSCERAQQTSDPVIGIVIQYRFGQSTPTFFVVESKTISNSPHASPGTVEQSNVINWGFGYDQNAPQRIAQTTVCSGQAAPVVSYSGTFSLLDTTRPDMAIGTGCPTGSRPISTTVIQQEQTPMGWANSPWAPKDVQCGTALPSTSIQCVTGFIASVSHVPAATDPSSPVAGCVTGTKTCEVVISKGTADCKIAANCPDYQQKKEQVAAGTTAWEQTGYQCSYDGVSQPMSQCVWVDPVAAPQATTTTTTGGLDGCGLSLSCYVGKLFVPTQANTQQRITQLKNAFEATPFGLVPVFFTGIANPFYQNPFTPNSENCAGPTLTLPKNMGVDGIDITGDYVIQPLYACPDTEAGEFGATISGGLRDILTPTVYVTGAYVVVNTLLSAMGLALPMLTRGADIDYNTGEIGPTRWRLRR